MQRFRKLLGDRRVEAISVHAPKLVVVALVGIIGVVLLQASHAGTPTASIEPEQGLLATCATPATDSTASNGLGVKFANCAGQIQTLSSVSQYGITWNFSSPKTVGQYANGDYWVLGPVTISSMTPAASGGRNGWQSNPPLVGNTILGGYPCVNNDCSGQAFDSASDPEFSKPSMMPALPYTANGGESIVKAVSYAHGATCGGSTPCLQTAAILTVVSSIPPNNGATVFRPPYVGTNKPLFTTAALDARISAMPRLASTSTIDTSLPTLQAALDRVKRPDIGYHFEEINDFHPVDNTLQPGDTNPYAPGVSAVYIDSVMRAAIVKSGDDENLRRQLLIALTQRGIDLWGIRSMGMHWYSAGGTNQGARGPIVFAAWMLNDAGIKTTLNDSLHNDFAETGAVWTSNRPDGQPVWGQDRGDATDYWNQVGVGYDGYTGKDPYGFVDGGYAPSTSYEQCCTAAAIKGEVLMVSIYPGMDTVWNDPNTIAFAKRWTTHGMLTSQDPCAPSATPAGSGQGGGQNGSGCVLDPDLTPGSTMTNFSCQAGKQCGRFPTTDGLVPNGSPGDWGYTSLQDKMWTQYGPR